MLTHHRLFASAGVALLLSACGPSEEETSPPTRRGAPPGAPGQESAPHEAPAQQPGPTGMWEGRWTAEGRSYQVADDIVGLAPGDRQLQAEGRFESRFDFCVAEDGSITGSGTATVERNGSAKLSKPYEDRGGGVHSDGRECEYDYAPTEADGPIRVLGQVQGEEFQLYLDTAPTMVDLRVTVECISWDPYEGQRSDGPPHTSTHSLPLLMLLGVATPPSVFTIPAQDGTEETEGFEARPGGNWTARFSSLGEHHIRVQIRRLAPTCQVDAKPEKE